MANNVAITAGLGTTFKTTDNAGVHTPHHNIDLAAAGWSVDVGNALSSTAVQGDLAGSIISQLRGINKTTHERLPATLGQTAMSAALSVVIASNQSGVPLGPGTAEIGGVKLNGPQFTRGTRTNVVSADASGAAVDLSLAPTSGQKLVIDSLFVSIDTARTVTIKDEDGTIVYKLFMAANTSVQITELTGTKLTTADKKLQLQTSGAGNVFAMANFHSEA